MDPLPLDYGISIPAPPHGWAAVNVRPSIWHGRVEMAGYSLAAGLLAAAAVLAL